MKKTFLLLAACLLTTMAWSQVPPITLNVPQAGTLNQIITPNRMFEITDLTLTGDLNGTDIRFIREMAGSDMKGNATTGKLVHLNLAGANIITGVDAYVANSYTSDNIISALMFSGIKLRTIVLPETATIIERDAFSYSTNLTGITFGSSVSTINLQAFEGCVSLREFNVTEQNQMFSSADGVLFNKTRTGLVCFPVGKSLSYVIPNNVRVIGPDAFANCSNLKSITIGSGVATIGANAFADCKNLTEVRSKNPAPPNLGAGAFAGETRTGARLYVPKGAFQVYWVTVGWSDFQHIMEETVLSSSQVTPEPAAIPNDNTELLAPQQEVFSDMPDSAVSTPVIRQPETVAETPDNIQEQLEAARRREIVDEILNRRIQENAGAETAASVSSEDQRLTDGFEQRKGRLPMPVEYGVVTAPFGAQQHSTLKSVIITNKGINIQTDNNADALAVFDGVVSQRFAFPGYNHAVIVRHGMYRTVYSNLTDVYVNVGDRVSAGQAIGKIFTDVANSKRTELFFMLYKSKELLNPCLFIGDKDCRTNS